LHEENFSTIYAKRNIVELLDAELSRKTWQHEIINIGGVADSYQKAEKDLKLMPDILRVLIKHKTPIIISTKSDLILRDFDLIAELSQLTYVNIASTIITLDETVRRKLEPGGCSSSARFSFLKEFRKTNASVGLHTMPIIPYLTDGYDIIEQLCAEAKKANVHYMLPGTLYLKGATRQVFFDFIKKVFPDKYATLKNLYIKGSADKQYKNNLYLNTVNPLRKKYGISSNYSAPMKEKMHKQ